ncbi:hypothetical protein MCOR27_004758 [Pyricularia oryzae]|nr:hypothetical protein MCOR01_008726 [Pyricularia oryzae]KAI6280181.1 hypothetical protein MCOR27_004758 [Pyricularia oryzae]KAI6327701.1 hypothetical protein MCOR29_002871 [Pyricularia oryzae]KAI6393907.1 hypothetical protein MCOR20_010710 [Pyricularia oryzae]
MADEPRPEHEVGQGIGSSVGKDTTDPTEVPPSPTDQPVQPVQQPHGIYAGGVGDGDGSDVGDDDDDGDADSALDVRSIGTVSDSLTSSILRFRVENGRTYHSYKDGSYFMPNDDRENERLNLQHNLCMMTIGWKLYISPIDQRPVNRVLDIGCGTGVWSMEFADDHPEAHVIGIDLSPIQPSFVPPNVSYYIDDVEAEWTYSTPFDFIFTRMMLGCIRNWPEFFQQSFDNLTPGGYLESFEPVFPVRCEDDTYPQECALRKWFDLLDEGTRKVRSELPPLEVQKQRLVDAGFVNIVTREYKWPMNTWPSDKKQKEFGSLVLANLEEGIQGMTMAMFTRVLGWTKEQVELFLVDVRKDIRNTNMHVYYPIAVISAQKPEQ